MPLRSAVTAAGIFEPEDVATIKAAFDRMALPEDTAIDRQTRAAALVRVYQNGTMTETGLLAAMGYEPTKDSSG